MNTGRELAIDELDAVSGGGGAHIPDVIIEDFGGGGGGGGGGDAGPALNAWNDLLRTYGYIK
jgi:hypothetical protein